MRKTLCGLGITLTLALSGCAPSDAPASPAATPKATSTTTSRADLYNDVATVDLAKSKPTSNPQTGQFGTQPPGTNADGSEFPSNNSNPTGVDAGNKALEGNFAEQQLASLALRHSDNEQVKQVAEMIVKDHHEAEVKLRAITGSSLPVVALNDKHQKLEKKLEGLKGAQFDKAFIDAMVAGHQETLTFYQAQAKNAPTQPLRDYFAETAPVIATHLDHCKKVQSGLKG